MAKKGDVLLLTRDEIESVVTMQDMIRAVAEGFKAFNSGRAVIPFPVALQIPDHKGDIHIKPGWMKGTGSYVVKIASGFEDNPKLGMPSSHGMQLLFDSRTGTPLAFLVDRGLLTDLRTAAAGAVAAEHLARKSIDKVAMIGTGTQGRLQMEALAKVRDFSMLRVWNRTSAGVEKYVAEMKKRLDAEIVPAATVEAAVRGSDVVVTATAATSPLVRAEWVTKGMHITAVGSDSPEKQELESGVLGKADKIVVDSLPQVLKLGEVHHAVEDGAIRGSDVHAELGEVLLGTKPGRESDDEITVCDLTGIAIQDVVASQMVYERALKEKMGRYIRV